MSDKKLVLTWDDIVQDSRPMIEKIAKSIPLDNVELVCVARGGLFVGGLVSYALGIKNVHSVALESYQEDKAGTNTKVKSRTPFLGAISYDRPDSQRDGIIPFYEHKTFLFLDDLNDTSQTYRYIKEQCDRLGIDYYFATIYDKRRENNLLPDFTGKEVDKDAWIVFPWDHLGD